MVRRDKECDTIPAISETRTKRYLVKIEHGRNRIDLIKSWLGEEDLQHDIKTVLAISKAFQEVAEVSVDLIAMLLKDNSLLPLDDYTNIDRVLELGVLSADQGPMLRETNGLRNRLIHVYNGLSVEVLFESIKRLLPGLGSYLEVIEGWLKQTSQG